MQTSFIVKQEHGKDSLVGVREDVIIGYPNDKQVLIFETDQSLLSNSDRAWNVENAIKDYANERGYEVPRRLEDKFIVIAIYNELHHSRQVEYKLRKQIQAHPDYLKAAKIAKSHADEINAEYGKHITELKYLVSQLEKSLQNQLKTIAADLVSEQVRIADEIGTENINDHHTFFSKHSLTKIEPTHYYKLANKLPDNLDDILALLNIR